VAGGTEGLLKDPLPSLSTGPVRPETRRMRTAAKIIVAGVSTVALAGGIGAGLAYANPTEPAPTPTATATPTAKGTPTEKAEPSQDGRKHRGLLRRALHGEVTLAGPQHRVVVFQRGPADEASATVVTVRSADGYTATYAIGAETKVRKNGKDATGADLEAGDRIFVTAVKGGSTPTAIRVRAAD
jgi:hypothetical protein